MGKTISYNIMTQLRGYASAWSLDLSNYEIKIISQRRKGAMFFEFVILRRGLEVLLFRSTDSNARTRMSGQTTIGPGWSVGVFASVINNLSRNN